MKDVSKKSSSYVKNLLTLLAIVLFFLVAPLGAARVPTISNVYAQGTGPQLFIQPAVQPLATTGSTVTFKVSVANMPSFGGYDVYVRTNNNVLSPTTITLSTFLPAGFENAHCVNNAGTSCDANDGLGVAHEAFASFGLASGSGTLFTITYTAVAGPSTSVGFPETVTTNTGLDFIFDSNGFNITGVPEIGGHYGGGFLGADFSFPMSLQIGQDAIFNSTVCCGTAPYSYGWTFGDGGVATASSPNHVYSSTGTFTVTLSVSDSSNPPLFSSVSHIVTVVPPDFAISATSISTLAPGGQGTSSVNVIGISRFNGTITLAIAPSHGLAVSLNANNIALNTSRTSQIVTLTVTGNAPGTYSVLIVGTSPGYAAHSTTITVGLSDFSLGASPTTIQSLSGNGMSTITVSSLFGFAGNVSLTTSSSPGLTGSITPNLIMTSGTAVLSVNGSPGVYSVTITGSSPRYQQHTLTITVDLGVDFSVIIAPANPLAPNTPGTSTVTASAINGFTGIISLVFIPAPGLTFSVNSTTITLTPGATSGVITITFLASTPGSYSLTAVASSPGLSHSSQTIIKVNTGGANRTGSILNIVSPRLLTETIWALSAIAITLSIVASILVVKLGRKKN